MTDRELLQEALESIKWLRIHLERDHGCLHMKPAVSGITDWLNKTEAALCARLATCDRCGKVNPAELHTCTPPQREWVGLTDEERREIISDTERDDRGYVMALVEAKLKEKNG